MSWKTTTASTSPWAYSTAPLEWNIPYHTGVFQPPISEATSMGNSIMKKDRTREPAFNSGQKLIWDHVIHRKHGSIVTVVSVQTNSTGEWVVTLDPGCGDKECARKGFCGGWYEDRLKLYKGG
jgi:hypothetical protein